MASSAVIRVYGRSSVTSRSVNSRRFHTPYPRAYTRSHQSTMLAFQPAPRLRLAVPTTARTTRSPFDF
eukprot:6181146-Pleurochrysis_carterae.AAC.1